MRAIALLALTGCTQIFGLTEPAQRPPADASPDTAPMSDGPVADAPIPPGSCDDTTLIACFDFEGSVQDGSSKGQVVTAVANVVFAGANGPDGMYAQIGLSSAITIAASTSFNTSAYTVAAWVRLNSLPQGPGTRVGVFDADARYGVFVNPSGSLLTRGMASPAGSIGINTWTHLAVTDDGGTITFYVNSAPLATVTINSAVPTSNAGAEIGGNAPTGDRMEGAIDALRVYSRVLTAAEVGDLASN